MSTGATVNGGAPDPESGPGPDAGPEHVVRWRELVELARTKLAQAAVCDNPAQEARWLAQRAGDFEPAELHLALNEPVTERSGTHFHLMLDRRLTGEPLQHVLERWSFRSLELVVDNRVLIPRPETEVLAGMALEECQRLDADLAVDLGTGSGAIALSLVVERPELEVWATDVSPEALSVAKANLAGLGRRALGVRMVEGRWFDALPSDLMGRIDVLVSNPPYVAPEEMGDLPTEVRDYEPEVALVAAERGLADIREILTSAPQWLARPGAVLLEMAPHQTTEAAGLARAAGFASVSVWPDLAGRDRVLLARL